jgi:hypothetical protein
VGHAGVEVGVVLADDASQAGEFAEELPDDGGEGDVVFCSPDARLAVGIVADGYGDVAHGCSLGLAGFWGVHINCAPRGGNYVQWAKIWVARTGPVDPAFNPASFESPAARVGWLDLISVTTHLDDPAI